MAMDDEKKVDLTQRFSLNEEDAAACKKIYESMHGLRSQEQAQRVFAAIREHAEVHGDEVRQASAGIAAQVFGSAPNAEAEAVDVSQLPMRLTGAGFMQSAVERSRQQQQNALDVAVAQRPSAPAVAGPAVGPTGMSQSSDDLWRQLTRPASGAPQEVAPQPVAAKADAPLTSAFFYGIWQITEPNGAWEELALGKSKFSIASGSGFSSSWGRWEMLENPGGLPVLILTREGWYPSKCFGPLGSSDLFQTVEEVLSITNISGDVVRFADKYMTRRTADVAAAIQRAGQVQTEGKVKNSGAQSAGTAAKSEFEINQAVQRSMWDHINRHRS